MNYLNKKDLEMNRLNKIIKENSGTMSYLKVLVMGAFVVPAVLVPLMYTILFGMPQ
jgi:hypothetical protein